MVVEFAAAALSACPAAKGEAPKARPTLSSVLDRKASLSANMALRIEKASGVKRDTLMRMQALYDIGPTRKHEKQIRVPRLPSPAAIHP